MKHGGLARLADLITIIRFEMRYAAHDNLPDPDVLAADIIENLQSALDSFKELQAQLRQGEK